MLSNQKLRDLVTKISAHQSALALSDEKFISRYGRFLNSVRTWRYRLVDGDLSDVTNPAAWQEKWVAKLAAMATEIDGVSVPETYLKDFGFAKQMTARLDILENQQTDRRCLVGLAVTGCGKSVWAGAEVADNPGERVYILCNESWREKRTVIASRVASKLGVDPGKSEADAVDAVRGNLSLAPKTVFFDSAQEAGIALMKLIRDWIDGTRSRFVYLGYATEFDRMMRATSGAVDEAKQLLGRSLKPIYDEYREGLRVKDVKLFLNANGITNGAANALAKEIHPCVRANGNLRFLDDAFTDARAEADDQGVDLTPEHIRTAVAALSPAQKEGK